MNEDEIIKLMDILIGNIMPIADSSVDKIRQENLKKLIAIIKHYHKKINDVLFETITSPYDSVKQFKAICDEYGDWLGIPE